jgi:tetratricopeptide (TPR) repeat protein
MPKIIKKKIIKPVYTEEDVGSIVTRLSEAAMQRQRQIVTGAVLIVVVLASAAGLFMYKSSIRDKAEGLDYEGYKLYFGLYEELPVSKDVRINRALESFQAAYETRRTPSALFYMSNCYYSLGKYDMTLEKLRELNREFPDDERFVPLSYYKMAMSSLKAGDNEGALKSLEILFNYRTDSLKDFALAESARILEAMGKLEESKEKYRLIIKDYPQSLYFEEANSILGKSDEGGEKDNEKED